MSKLAIVLSFILTSSLSFSQVIKKAEIVSVNGKTIHYEVYGEGPPLLLLHGYSMSSKSWLPYVSDYDQEYGYCPILCVCRGFPLFPSHQC